MNLPNTDFYYFPEFKAGQEKKLLLLQVDIEGHSKLSKEKRPTDVMSMKVELAELLNERLGSVGFKGIGWQGDGGMFALDVSNEVTHVDKASSSWRLIRHVIESISKRYDDLLEGELIPLRTSAHVCNVLVHPDPCYWHAEGINEFAKAERDLGRRDAFVITGELFRELPAEAKKEFELLPQSLLVGQREDVYRFSAGIPGDRNMDFIPSEMRSIQREVRSFSTTLQNSRKHLSDTKPEEQKILVIVDLQKDFAGDSSLAVPNAEKLAEKTYILAEDAIRNGISVVVTRDWHPKGHASFETWPAHCVTHTDGAEFLSEFNYESLEGRVQLANIGISNEIPDYNPYHDQGLHEFMLYREPEVIYVTGIALEYCVLASCLASQAYSTSVIALEDYILSAKSDQAKIAWDLLENSGVKRIKGNPFGV